MAVDTRQGERERGSRSVHRQRKREDWASVLARQGAEQLGRILCASPPPSAAAGPDACTDLDRPAGEGVSKCERQIRMRAKEKEGKERMR